VAFVGADRVTTNVSFFSSAESPIVLTVTTFWVSPGANVRVPDAAA
jgi:hypothetical protein